MKVILKLILLHIILIQVGHMSGMKLKEIDLEALVKSPCYIVHAKKAEIFESKNTKDELFYHFIILENLGMRVKIEEGISIKVRALKLIKEIPSNKWGIRKSYQASVKLEDENELILFLSKEKDTYGFVYEGSFEGIEKKEVIINIIKEAF